MVRLRHIDSAETASPPLTRLYSVLSHYGMAVVSRGTSTEVGITWKGELFRNEVNVATFQQGELYGRRRPDTDAGDGLSPDDPIRWCKQYVVRLI